MATSLAVSPVLLRMASTTLIGNLHGTGADIIMKAWHVALSTSVAAILGITVGALLFRDQEVSSLLTAFLITLVVSPLLALLLAKRSQ